MTQLTTEQIRELNKKRTQGDWRLIPDYERHRREAAPLDVEFYLGVQMGEYGGFTIHKDCNPDETARFIAAAPQIAKQYLELSEKLDKAVRGLEKIADANSVWATTAKQTLEEITKGVV